MTEYRTDFDMLEKELSQKPVDPGRLITEEPTPNTQRLWEFLRSCKGKKFISGQQYLWEDEMEDLVYYNVTGKLPAIRGYDFMGISGLARGYDQIGRALDWARRTGGILTMCWHWNAPDDMENIDRLCSFYYKTTQYDHKTSFDIIRAMQEGTPEHRFVIEEIDMVAGALKIFQQADIPVIWRPLHEANGNWFWWGNRGEESVQAYKKLWYTIFDRFMNYHKLKNLIWVWNGQSNHCAIHPNSYDIAGTDKYYDGDDTSAAALTEYYNESYKALQGYDAKCAELAGLESTGKMLTLSECGYIPDPQGCVDNNNMWLYYMVWNGDFIYDTTDSGAIKVDLNGTPSPNPERLTNEMLVEYFGNDAYITLKKLPEFSFGTRDIPQKIKNWEYFKVG